jgi:hypothetical protein
LIDWDFDKVHEMASNHDKLRQMIGHGKMDFDAAYALQTIKDNVSLLTPQILDEIKQIIVQASHDLVEYAENPLILKKTMGKYRYILRSESESEILRMADFVQRKP